MQSLRRQFAVVAAFTLLLVGVWINDAAAAICQSSCAVQNETAMATMPCCASPGNMEMTGGKAKPCSPGMAILCAASDTSSTPGSMSASEIVVPAPALTGQVHLSLADIGRFSPFPPFQRHTPLLPPPLHQVRLII